MTEIPEKVMKLIGDRPVEDSAVKVRYKNYRGEVGTRRIIPLHFSFDKTEYHQESQYLLEVWDLDKEAYRTYALKDIEEWLEFPK